MNERTWTKQRWSGLVFIIGSAIGVVLWQITDTLVLFPIVVGVGLLVALAVGSDRAQD